MAKLKKQNSTANSFASDAAEQQDEVDGIVNMRQFIVQYINKFFVNHIPMESLKELSPVCK